MDSTASAPPGQNSRAFVVSCLLCALAIATVGGLAATGPVAAGSAVAAPAAAGFATVEPVAVGPASASHPATASVTDTAAPAPCEDVADRPAVVATTGPDAPYGPGEDVGVYRGSVLDLVLCDAPAGDRSFRANAPDGLEVHGRDGTTARVRVVGPSNASLGALVGPNAVPGPGVAVRGRRVETSLLDESLAVASPERADALAAAEATYRDRAATYRDRLDALANATAAIRASGRTRGDALNATLEARSAYRNALSTYRGELYAIADGDGSRDAGAAVLALETRHEALEDTARERVAAYDAALVERQRSLVWGIRLRAVGLGLVGLLVGAVAGAALPVSRGRLARRRLARGEWTTYSRRAAFLPAAVGLVALLVGVGWLAVTAGPALWEVVG